MTAHFVHLLDDVRRQSLRMASAVEDVLQEACHAYAKADQRLAERVIRRDNDIDDAEVAVEAEVIRLMSLFQPMGSDMRLLCTILKVNNDLERIADCAVNIAERVQHLESEIVADIGAGLSEMADRVRQMLRKAIQAYGNEDEETAREVLTDDETVDAAYSQFIRFIVDQAGRDPGAIAAQLDLLSVAKNLERIADHAVNIAEDVIFLATGTIVRHRNA